MDDGAGTNWCFVNGTVGVNSQSQKNKGKITISIQNKGTNARALIYNIYKKVRDERISQMT